MTSPDAVTCSACQSASSSPCPGFHANPLRRHVCRECFHEAADHEGLSDEEQSFAILSKGGDRTPSCIVPGQLYMGGMLSAMNLPALKEAGITHVVNAAKDIGKVWPKFREHRDEFTYLNLSLDDVASQGIHDALDTAVAFIADAVEGGGCVFVHCAQGVSRSGAVVVGYVMHSQQLGFDDALALARKGRICCRPNTGFVKQLRERESQ